MGRWDRLEPWKHDRSICPHCPHQRREHARIKGKDKLTRWKCMYCPCREGVKSG